MTKIYKSYNSIDALLYLIGRLAFMALIILIFPLLLVVGGIIAFLKILIGGV